MNERVQVMSAKDGLFTTLHGAGTHTLKRAALALKGIVSTGAFVLVPSPIRVCSGCEIRREHCQCAGLRDV